MKNNIYAVIVKNTNRAISMIDESMINRYMKKFMIFDVVPIVNTGAASFRTAHGTINAISLLPEDIGVSGYYIITDYPDCITLEQAYEAIAEKKQQ